MLQMDLKFITSGFRDLIIFVHSREHPGKY